MFLMAAQVQKDTLWAEFLAIMIRSDLIRFQRYSIKCKKARGMDVYLIRNLRTSVGDMYGVYYVEIKTSIES